VLNGPEGSSAVLNAANEVAVAAFLDGAIRFTDIHRVNQHTLDAVAPSAADGASLDDLLRLDARARAAARQAMQQLKNRR
jgi:1-deoxy-D-xylulose-5-phosphate reductoisomerase